MKRKVLVDTSVIIDFLRRKDKEKTLFYVISQYDMCVSLVTHTELYAGRRIWEHPKEKKSLEEVLSGLTILAVEQNISQEAGYIKAYYNNTILDSIIAATAIAHDLELVTLNRKDFEKVKNLKLFS